MTTAAVIIEHHFEMITRPGDGVIDFALLRGVIGTGFLLPVRIVKYRSAFNTTHFSRLMFHHDIFDEPSVHAASCA